MDPDRQKEVGPQADVYGFGKTCYYALFGSPTPDDDDKDGLPEGLKRLLSRCTSQAVAKRPQSFTEVVEQLAGIERALAPSVEEVEAVGAVEAIPAEAWYYSQSGQQTGPVSEDRAANADSGRAGVADGHGMETGVRDVGGGWHLALFRRQADSGPRVRPLLPSNGRNRATVLPRGEHRHEVGDDLLLGSYQAHVQTVR